MPNAKRRHRTLLTLKNKKCGVSTIITDDKKMKKYLMTLIFLLRLSQSYGQSFLNGNFENNILFGCDYNNTDIMFNTKISNVYAFGKGYTFPNGYAGEIDIQTTGCYVTPQNGNWCLGLASDTTSNADAVAIELTSNLIIGQSYQISFYVFGNTYSGALTNLKIGVSDNDSTFGNLLHTAIPDANSWKHIVFDFIASQSDKFITVTNISGIDAWNQIDNFTISYVTGISESAPEEINIYPNPFTSSTIMQTSKILKDATITVYNLSGQQVKQINNISEQTITLTRDNLPSGLYFVQLTQHNKVITRAKLVIID
jgi:hypothetical protein